MDLPVTTDEEAAVHKAERMEKYLESVTGDGDSSDVRKSTDSKSGGGIPPSSSSSSSVKPSEMGAPIVVPDDPFAHAFMEFLRPVVVELDDRVAAVRESQMELRTQIDLLAIDLRKIADEQKQGFDIDPHLKKLSGIRRRIMLVNNVVQNAQERVLKLHNNVLTETAKTSAELTGAADK